MDENISQVSKIPQEPEIQVQLQKSWLKVVLIAIFGLILVGSLVYGGYKFGLSKRFPSQVQRIDCKTDSDCVLVLDRQEECCRCPIAVNKSELTRNKNLMIYLPGEIGWSQVELPECKNIACSPCPWWAKAICESGLCRGAVDLSPTPSPFVSTPTPDPTVGWKNYKSEKLGFEVKYPNLPNWNYDDSGTKGEGIVVFYNYDVKKAPGRSYSLSDGDLLKIRVWIASEPTLENWTSTQKQIIDPVTGKPQEVLTEKEILVDSQRGILMEIKDSLTDLLVGSAAFKSPSGKVFVLGGNLNYQGNKQLFDQILSTFKFLSSDTITQSVSGKTYTYLIKTGGTHELKYPSDWSYIEASGAGGESSVIFYKGTEFNNNLPNVSLNRIPNNQKLTLDQWLLEKKIIFSAAEGKEVAIGGIKGKELSENTDGYVPKYYLAYGNYIFLFRRSIGKNIEEEKEIVKAFNQITDTFKFLN